MKRSLISRSLVKVIKLLFILNRKAINRLEHYIFVLQISFITATKIAQWFSYVVDELKNQHP